MNPFNGNAPNYNMHESNFALSHWIVDHTLRGLSVDCFRRQWVPIRLMKRQVWAQLSAFAGYWFRCPLRSVHLNLQHSHILVLELHVWCLGAETWGFLLFPPLKLCTLLWISWWGTRIRTAFEAHDFVRALLLWCCKGDFQKEFSCFSPHFCCCCGLMKRH